jgi:hypothetical protein
MLRAMKEYLLLENVVDIALGYAKALMKNI